MSATDLVFNFRESGRVKMDFTLEAEFPSSFISGPVVQEWGVSPSVKAMEKNEEPESVVTKWEDTPKTIVPKWNDAPPFPLDT